MKKVGTRQTQLAKQVKKPETPAKEESKQRVVKSNNKIPSKPQKQIQRSEQTQCKLFKIPNPVLIQIILFATSSGKEYLKLSLTCQKLRSFICKDPRLWLSLILFKFPKVLGDSQQSLKDRLADGYMDTSGDWKSLYIKEYIAYVHKSNQENIKKLTNLCKSSTAPGFFKKFKDSNPKIVLKNIRFQDQVLREKVKFFGLSLLFKADYEFPTQKLHSLLITLYGRNFSFDVENKTPIVQGDLSIVNNDQGMEIQLSGDTYTQYWIIPYAELFSKLTNYSIPPQFDDISSNYGKINYTLYFEFNSLTAVLASHIERNLDLSDDSNTCQGIIDNLKYRIPKENLIIDWKSLAFSKKIQNVGIINVTVFDEQGRLFLWTSQAASLSLIEQNGNQGDGYSASVTGSNFTSTIYLRDKGKSFLLSTILLSIPSGYIKKQFITNRFGFY